MQYLQQAWQLQTSGMRGNQKSILLNINHTFRYRRKSTVSALHSPHNTQRFNSLHSACLPNPPDAPYKTWADGGKQVRSGQPPPDSWHGVNVPATRVQVLLLARSGGGETVRGAVPSHISFSSIAMPSRDRMFLCSADLIRPTSMETVFPFYRGPFYLALLLGNASGASRHEYSFPISPRRFQSNISPLSNTALMHPHSLRYSKSTRTRYEVIHSSQFIHNCKFF